MQVCTLLQKDNHASTPPLSFYRPDALPGTEPTPSKHWNFNQVQKFCISHSGVAALYHVWWRCVKEPMSNVFSWLSRTKNNGRVVTLHSQSTIRKYSKFFMQSVTQPHGGTKYHSVCNSESKDAMFFKWCSDMGSLIMQQYKLYYAMQQCSILVSIFQNYGQE